MLSVARGVALLFAKKGPAEEAGEQPPAQRAAGQLVRLERQRTRRKAPAGFARGEAHLGAEERAEWEAAIQLDVVTADEARKHIANRKTVRTWIAEQKQDDRKLPSRKSDKLLVLALLLFNALALAAIGAALVWLFRTVT